MDHSHNLYRLLKPFSILSIIIFISSFLIFCNKEQSQKDLKNALTITQTLKNSKSSAPKHFTPVPQHPQNNTDKNTSYTVKHHILKPGESLQDLAILYDTDWQSIQRANGIKNLSEIKPGQKILIPIKKSDQQ